ncbi:unnamed protein product [Ceutorhynchus assimilis]|uniref:MGA conserved domain-containing protein n=1 Tax=Ceutorhynchus assimilis TaxID=467358 RepID=A0A9N9QJ84_9CUCU|nr:unnamed protein product [Ceutorhynchus assimilis]
MEVDTVCILDSDDESHESLDDKLTLTDEIVVNKMIKTEIKTGDILMEYSDNEVDDDNFDTNNLIEYDEASNQPDDDDDVIVIVEDISPNGKTSPLCKVFQTADKIKKEHPSEPLVDGASSSLPKHDDAETPFCFIASAYSLATSKSPIIIEENPQEETESAINEVCHENLIPNDVEAEDKENDDPESVNKPFCFIGSPYTVPETSLTEKSQEKSIHSPQNLDSSNSDLISFVEEDLKPKEAAEENDVVAPSFVEKDSLLLESTNENDLEIVPSLVESTNETATISVVEDSSISKENSNNQSSVEDELFNKIDEDQSLKHVSSFAEESFKKNDENVTSDVDEEALLLYSSEEYDTPNYAEEDLLLMDSPIQDDIPKRATVKDVLWLVKERSESNTPTATSSVVDTSRGGDKIIVEDSLPESVEENSEVATSCFEEDSLLLDPVRVGSETSKDDTSLNEGDSLLVTSSEERSEANTPKTTQSSVEEDSLRENSSKDATNFVGKDCLSKEDAVCKLLNCTMLMESSLENAANCIVEDSLLLESSKDVKVVEQDSLQSPAEDNEDESLNNVSSFIEKDTLSLESSNSPGTEEEESIEANSNLEKIDNNVEQDSLQSTDENNENEGFNNALSFAEKDAMLLESSNSPEEGQSIEVNFNLKRTYNNVEQDSLQSPEKENTDESLNKASNFVEKDTLPLESSHRGSHSPETEERQSIEGNSNIEKTDKNDKDSLVLESSEDVKVVEPDSLQSSEEDNKDESFNNASSFAEKDELPLEKSNSPKHGTEDVGQSIEANSNLEKTDNDDKDLLLSESSKDVKVVEQNSLQSPEKNNEDESLDNASSFVEEDTLPLGTCNLEKTDNNDKDSLFLESSKDNEKNLKVLEQDSLQSPEEDNEDESLDSALSFSEKDVSPLESTNSPKHGTEEGQSIEANSNLAKTDNNNKKSLVLESAKDNEKDISLKVAEQDSLRSPEKDNKDESLNEVSNFVEKDTLFLESSGIEEEESREANSNVEKIDNNVEQDSLHSPEEDNKDESVNNASSFLEKYVLPLESTNSPKHGTEVEEQSIQANFNLMPKTNDIHKDSLLLEFSIDVKVLEQDSQQSLEENNEDESLDNASEKDALSLESSNSPKHVTEEAQANSNLEKTDNSDTLVKGTSEDHTVPDINNDASTSAIRNDEDVQENDEENNETLKDSEEIRNSIRMQLTNLRKGKNKFNFFKDVQPKTSFFARTDEEVIKKPFVQPKIVTVSTVEKRQPEVIRPKETEKVEPQEDDNVSNALSELRKIINKPKLFSKKEANKQGPNKTTTANEPVETKPVHRPNNSSSTTTDIRKIIGTLNTDIEDSNSNDKLDSELNDNNSNPFVSNTLDEFLTDSKLNVSYDIPKSAAEEGIIKDYSLDPLMLIDPQTSKDEEEKADKDTKKITKASAYKPKTLAEKRRILEKTKLEQKNIKDEFDTRSYVMFKNKKVFLHSKYQSKCLAYVESDVPKKPVRALEVNKPSLLKELFRKSSPVKYRPGPLSRKHRLQSDYSQWTTELKSLPTVTLSIMPEFRKAVHPNLLGIINNQWDAEVSEDQVEFALSALKTNEPQNKIFNFELNYENKQEKLLARKKLRNDGIAAFKTTAKNLFNHEDDDKVVAQVIENLINYVEIKEIAPTLIKDEVFDNDEHLLQEKVIKYKRGKRRNFNKTNRELLRLNCKVVTMEEDEDDTKNECSKPYCRLGCVCNSLKSEHLIGVGKHCQKVACMFECSCPKYAREFLTTDTVTKIEDISKKYLAKEEKEFTQTVICTNDKTFVVGMSAKPRRAAKLPKKYSDFFDEDVYDEKSTINKKVQLIPCSVTMDKLNFSGIVPYCWVHYLYNCHCNGTSISFEKKLASENDKKKLTSRTRKAPKYFEQSRLSGRKVPKKSLQHKYVYQEEEDLDDDGTVSRTLPYEDHLGQDRKRENTEELTANDFINNMSQSDRLRALTLREVPLDRLNASDALKQSIIQERKLVIGHQRKQQHMVREEQSSDLTVRKTITSTTRQRKRPSAKTSNPEYRKKIKIVEAKSEYSTSQQSPQITSTITEQNETCTTITQSKVESVFDGEIICNDSAWLKRMCNNTQQPADSYARILPWDALLNGFLLKTINVYCLWDAPLRLVLTKNIKIRAARYLDVMERGRDILRAALRGTSNPGLIRQSETVRDIIKWLITGSLHTKYSSSTLSFLLVEVQPKRFEVRGCCTQKPKTPVKSNIQSTIVEAPEPEMADIEEPETAEIQSAPVSPAQSESMELSEENNENIETDNLSLDESAQSELTETKHKNMYNQVMSLFITRSKFKSTELIEDGCDDDLSDNLYMWVELPNVRRLAKWRVIFLKNDFMYLFFKTVKYSIKYTDIVKLTEIAKDFNSTLMVRNMDIRRCHSHPLYGLHISPKHLDRFFIGPYYIDFMDEDIDTLVYKNQSLVSSSSLKGGDNTEKCGAWMFERGEAKIAVVDLTEDDTPTPTPAPIPSTSSSSTVTLECQVVPPETVSNFIMPEPFKILSNKPRMPSEFNRFIVTNIPHFGYLGAYQPDGSESLEVSWPFEGKVLQFDSCARARDFLQRRFKNVLQPIPVTFDIQVIVLLNLDRNENQPIQAKYLKGNCICGSFGTRSIDEITEEFCQKELNMPKKDILQLFTHKAHDYMQAKVNDLAKLNCINYKRGVSVNVIFDKTKNEIQKQQQQLLLRKATIETLENKARTNLKKVYSLIKDLPITERNLETKILHETIRIRPKGLGSINATRVIEIPDDDAVPSTSGANFNFPNTSGVNFNIPSTSGVNFNVPSTSGVNFSVHSTSGVNFNVPGTSLLKPVSTPIQQRSVPSLYPISASNNNKSLLKINAQKNVPEEDSSEDVVWIIE